MTNVTDKKYLKLRHKLAYGSGDLGTNFCYSLVANFVLIYLTDAVGLNAGIIGTLMMVSRILDGITDVLAGNMIDRTRHRWGKARPWMIYTIVPLAVCEVLLFSTPSMAQTLQYAYFFVVYTVLNNVFYTANNVAYSTLSMLITKNKNERVQLGAYRFIFTMVGSVLITSLTMVIVGALGGGVSAWRTVAMIYAAVFTLFQVICVTVLKELPQDKADNEAQEQPKLFSSLKYILKNMFFVRQLVIGILYNGVVVIYTAVGIYYMRYVLGNDAMLALFALTMALPMAAGLASAPMIIKKVGIYRTIFWGMIGCCIFDIAFIFAALKGNLALMLTFNSLRWLCSGPYASSVTALTAEISGYTLRKDKKRLEGGMFSCTSMGLKVGAGLGTAVTGWILAAGGYINNASAQPPEAISAISFLYVILPLIVHVAITLLTGFQNVEKANMDWDKQHISVLENH